MIQPSAEFMPYVQAVGRGIKLRRDLTYDEAVDALRLMLNGSASDAQMGAFLIAQRVKGESLDEVRAFTDVVRSEFLTAVTHSFDRLLDLATPYNGKSKTAQLAPAIAFTLAAAGLPVVLHGAENIPTKSGVTVGHVLDGLGVPIGLTSAEASTYLAQHKVAYIDASQFAPAWVGLTPIRHHFGLRTVFNTVEKWFNPANAPFQVSGFFHANYIKVVRSAQTGGRRSFVVQGEEGSIEMAAGRRTPIYATEAAHDVIADPTEVGLPVRERVSVSAEIDAHVAINQHVLAGQPGPALDQVAFTVGTLLHLFGLASSRPQGYATATEILRDGGAAAMLNAATSLKTTGATLI